MFVFANPLAGVTGLSGEAREFALMYIRMLAFAVPFLTTMFVANRRRDTKASPPLDRPAWHADARRLRPSRIPPRRRPLLPHRRTGKV